MGSGYRKGVLTGEYVEHLASMGAGTETEVPKTFNATTTSSEAFSPSGKTGAQLLKASSREDIKLKYGKYGKVEPLGDGSGGCFATLTQLAYSQPPMASASSGDGTRACEDRKINEFIWSGSNVGDSKVPKSVKAQKMAGERRQKLATEAKRNPYLTTEKASESLAEAASNPKQRAAAKPAACRPQAEGGQMAQVGKKATGEFLREMDKDFLKIGLRK